MMEKQISLSEALTGMKAVVPHLDGRKLFMETDPARVIADGARRPARARCTVHTLVCACLAAWLTVRGRRHGAAREERGHAAARPAGAQGRHVHAAESAVPRDAVRGAAQGAAPACAAPACAAPACTAR